MMNARQREICRGECSLPCPGRERWVELLERRAKSLPAATGKIPSRGVGDTIAKVTTAIGLSPCGGCKNRQEALNKLFPYKGQTYGAC